MKIESKGLVETRASESYSGDSISVWSDIYVEGLEECIVKHLCNGSNFTDTLQDVVNLLIENGLLNIDCYR